MTSTTVQLRRAQAELDQVDGGTDDRMVFLHAHMAALRAAAAVVAAAVPPGSSAARRSARRSVWEQLAEAGEEWQPWAAYFASGAPIRAAIDSDRQVPLTPERAQEALAAATDFVALVADRLATLAVPSAVSALAS